MAAALSSAARSNNRVPIVTFRCSFDHLLKLRPFEQEIVHQNG
jgi:hypothetical protein